MEILNRFQGYSSHRYKKEPLEKLFAQCWQEMNNHKIGKCVLDYLAQPNIMDQYVSKAELTDYKFASTIIQWLGSPVGQYFLSQVIKKSMEQKIPMTMFEPVDGCFGKSLIDPNWG